MFQLSQNNYYCFSPTSILICYIANYKSCVIASNNIYCSLSLALNLHTKAIKLGRRLGSLQTHKKGPSKIMEHQEAYNLRAEEAWKKPERYRCEQTEATLQLKALKRKKAGGKTLITQKINQIGELISGRGSRTKITYLRDKLNEALAGTIKVHEEMMKLLDESNQSEDKGWIEDITYTVDTCNSDVKEYLDSRKDGPPSGVSSVISWLNCCTNEDITTEAHGTNILEKEVIHRNLSDLAKDINNLTLKTMRHTYETQVTVRNTNNQHYDPGGVSSPQTSMLNPTVQPFTQSQGISNGKQIKSTTNKFIQNRQNYQKMSAGTMHQPVRNRLSEIPLDKSSSAMPQHRANKKIN